MAELRDARVNPPTVPVVTETGAIKDITVGKGIGGAVVYSGGKFRVGEAWKDKGWKLLREHYGDEKDEEGWKRYEQYREALAKGQVAPGFPDKFLPKSVLKLRQQNPKDDAAKPKFEDLVGEKAPKGK
jgi:hypothetical protein